jgi:osmotically inducible protein OsmC
VRVTATVAADKGDAGIKIARSHLKAVVEDLEGIDRAKLQEIAEAAEKGCPVSNAMRGAVAITVEATAA